MVYADTLTLYRGDYSKIDQFSFHKTNKGSLFGAGIYLTEALKVADTYRIKGAPFPVLDKVKPDTLYSGSAENRKDALEKAFKTFLNWALKGDLIPHRKGRTVDQKTAIHELFKSWIESGLIQADYLSHRVPRSLQVTCKWPESTKVGHISCFHFPRKPFLDAVIPIDTCINDSLFWELMFDAKIDVGTPYSSRDDFVRFNIGQSLAQVARNPGLCRKIRNVLEPFGYRGFKYQGGAYTGGVGAHAAYVVWDDNYVNEHRVY